MQRTAIFFTVVICRLSCALSAIRANCCANVNSFMVHSSSLWMVPSAYLLLTTYDLNIPSFFPLSMGLNDFDKIFHAIRFNHRRSAHGPRAGTPFPASPRPPGTFPAGLKLAKRPRSRIFSIRPAGVHLINKTISRIQERAYLPLIGRGRPRWSRAPRPARGSSCRSAARPA